MQRRIARAASALCLSMIAVALFVGCGGKTTSPVPVVPTAAPSSAGYAAFGASDAVGAGASVPCGVSTSLVPSCPGGTGYVPDIANLLGKSGIPVTLTDLGISAALIGPDIRTLANQYGTTVLDMSTPRTLDAIPADYLTGELPKYPSSASYVTILSGPNEILALANALGCGAGGTTVASQQAFITTQTQAFASDYANLIGAIQAATPKARIVVVNVPNLAGLPFATTEPTSVRQMLQTFSVAFDTSIDALTSQGIPVVDVLCSPAAYTAANYSGDGFHPNDLGYSILASLMESELVSGALASLSTSCPPASIISTSAEARQPISSHVTLPSPTSL